MATPEELKEFQQLWHQYKPIAVTIYELFSAFPVNLDNFPECYKKNLSVLFVQMDDYSSDTSAWDNREMFLPDSNPVDYEVLNHLFSELTGMKPKTESHPDYIKGWNSLQTKSIPFKLGTWDFWELYSELRNQITKLDQLQYNLKSLVERCNYQEQALKNQEALEERQRKTIENNNAVNLRNAQQVRDKALEKAKTEKDARDAEAEDQRKSEKTNGSLKGIVLTALGLIMVSFKYFIIVSVVIMLGCYITSHYWIPIQVFIAIFLIYAVVGGAICSFSIKKSSKLIEKEYKSAIDKSASIYKLECELANTTFENRRDEIAANVPKPSELEKYKDRLKSAEEKRDIAAKSVSDQEAVIRGLLADAYKILNIPNTSDNSDKADIDSVIGRFNELAWQVFQVDEKSYALNRNKLIQENVDKASALYPQLVKKSVFGMTYWNDVDDIVKVIEDGRTNDVGAALNLYIADEQNKKLRKELENQKKETARTRAELSNKIEEQREAIEREQRLTREQAARDQEYALKEYNRQLDELNKQHQKTYNQLKQKMDDQASTMNELRKQNSQLFDQNEELRNQTYDMQNQLYQQSLSFDDLQNRHDELLSDNDDLRDRVDRANRQVKDVRDAFGIVDYDLDDDEPW